MRGVDVMDMPAGMPRRLTAAGAALLLSRVWAVGGSSSLPPVAARRDPWEGPMRGGRTFDDRHFDLCVARRRKANRAARLARRVQRGRRA